MVARALTGFAYHATFDEAFQPLHVSGSRSVSSTESFRDSHDPWSRTGALRVINMASDLEIHDVASSSTLSCGYDRHFRTLAESLPQIVWLASADCCVGYQNRRWCEYTGLSSAGSMGFGWKRAFHADDLPETLRRWERAVREGEPCELAFRLRRSDGVYRWFRAGPSRSWTMKTGRSGGSRHAARATTRCQPSKACDQLSHQDNDWTGSYSKKYWRSRQVTFTFLTSPHVETSMEIRRPGTTLATRQTSLRRWARSCCPRSCIPPIWHGSTSTSHASIPP